jgi:hypothetical protein
VDVFLDALLNGFAHLGMDLKVSVRRTQPPNTLVGPLVVVILHPEAYALPRVLKARELDPGQILLKNRLPEALDLTQRHGMVGPGFDLVHPVLLHLGLEARASPPTGILAAIVGEHLLGRVILRRSLTIDFQYIVRRLAAEKLQPWDVPGKIVNVADQVGIVPAQAERENVRLPHLVGRGSLKKPRPGDVFLTLGGR